MTNAAYYRLAHLPPLVPYPLDDANGDRGDHARHQEEERGINVGESRAVESGGRRAARHRRQHSLLNLVQHAVLGRAQNTKNGEIKNVIVDASVDNLRQLWD